MTKEESRHPGLADAKENVPLETTGQATLPENDDPMEGAVVILATRGGWKTPGPRCAVSSGVDIVDEDLFFGEFRDWLYAGGYNVKGTEEMVAKMEVFKEYQAPGFSFVRLSKLYEASAADLLPLPSCKEDWLCSFADIDTACCAYTLLLGFLRHLLKDHGDCGHITREESRRRLGHLEKMSREYSQVFHRARRT